MEKACNFINKRFQNSCFPVNILKFLRIPNWPVWPEYDLNFSKFQNSPFFQENYYGLLVTDFLLCDMQCDISYLLNMSF